MKAWKEHAHLWDMEDKVVVAETREEASGSASAVSNTVGPGQRKAKGIKRAADGAARSQAPPAQLTGVSQAQLDSKKQKLCGSWNAGKSGDPCFKRQRHACNIRLRNGRVCEGDHPAIRCPSINR